MRTRIGLLVAGALLALPAAACSGTPGQPASNAASTKAAASGVTVGGSDQAPVPAESNPPGDIPDTQAFVAYRSDSGGFDIRVPEGWARRDAANAVTFADHLNMIQVSWRPGSAPSVDRANTQDVPELQRTQLAFQLRKVSAATLPAGSAVLVESQENGPPDQVTGKQYRIDVLRYEMFHNGRQAVLLLSSPVGSDNVDPWKVVAESFRWR